MTIKQTKLQDEDFEYWNEQERAWQNTRDILSQKELYEIFLKDSPEIITDKIRELSKEYGKLEKAILEHIRLIQKESRDKSERLVLQGILEQIHIRELLAIEKEIKRLHTYRNFQSGKENIIIDIDKAKHFPIDRLVDQTVRLRKMGDRLVGLCPFHKEKTPSFYLYANTNSFYCYGCNMGGDVIHLTRLLYGFSFPEAVKHLITNL